MGNHFQYFIDTIPENIFSNTKATICKYIAIFEPEGFVVEEKLHFDDYHFVLFFSGSPITKINGQEHQFRKGDLIVIQPWDEVYALSGDAKKWGKYISISVNKEFFEKTAFKLADEQEFHFNQQQSAYSKQLLDLIGSFQRELMNYGEAYPIMLESICIQLVCQLIRELNSYDSIAKHKISKENKYISKTIQLMQQHYSTNISINDICNMIYLSPCHFKRVFKENTGQTPYQYLMRIRLDKAKELLEKSENTMEEVARLCGFVNSGHFSTAFKRAVGISPSEYRKMELSI